MKRITDTSVFINNFIGKDENYGVLRPDRFVVKINLPAIVKSKAPAEDDLIFNIESFQCSELKMDMDAMELNSIKHQYYKRREDSNISITFYESANYKFRRFFYYWLNLGFNLKTGVRKYVEEIESPRIEITPLGINNKVSYSDIFEQVIPIGINDLDFDYSKSGEILKTKVDFSYVYHTIDSSHLK